MRAPQSFYNCACTSFSSLAIAGDILIGNGDLQYQLMEEEGISDIAHDIQDLIPPSEVFCANFEGIISDYSLAPRPKNLPPVFSIRSSGAIVPFLSSLPNLVLTFANNHSADYGAEAIQETKRLLQSHKLAFVGMGENEKEASRGLIAQLRFCSVAFLAFTDMLSEDCYATKEHTGIAKLERIFLKHSIDEAKINADVVIVFLHTISNPLQPFSFFPDRHQRMWSRMAIDYGADVVIGQQPHGLQIAESYRNKIIFYSLGAFLYDPRISYLFPKKHPLHASVQMYGGAVISAACCRHGIQNFSIIPTKTIRSESRKIRIVKGAVFLRTAARIIQWSVS